MAQPPSFEFSRLINGLLLTGVGLGHDYRTPKKIGFQNPNTLQIRELPERWNWTCFFSPLFFGLPLLFFGLNALASVVGMVALIPVLPLVSNYLLPHRFLGIKDANLSTLTSGLFLLTNLFMFVLQVWLGYNGTRLIKRKYLQMGWLRVTSEAIKS